MQREKIDFLLALGEKLCRLSGTESTEHLARVTSGDSRESPTVDRRWDEAPEEYLSIIANMVNEIWRHNSSNVELWSIKCKLIELWLWFYVTKFKIVISNVRWYQANKHIDLKRNLKLTTFFDQQVTDRIVSQPAGQEAVKSVQRFLSYNSEWLQTVLGIGATTDLTT